MVYDDDIHLKKSMYR